MSTAAACSRCAARALPLLRRPPLRPAKLPGSSRGHASTSAAPQHTHSAIASSTWRTGSTARRLEGAERQQRRALSSSASTSDAHKAGSTKALGHEYSADDYTNVPASILSRVGSTPVLLSNPTHPLSLLKAQIEAHLAALTPSAAFTPITPPQPIVSADLNFSDLGFPPNHPGRSPTDTYYLNRDTCLRTHTSAHEVEVFRAGHKSWLLAADVFRRDEIDASHYPIFHQMEGARIFSLDQYEPSSSTGSEGKSAVELECEAIEARLAASDVQIEVEDAVKLDEAGGIQPSHDERVALLAARHLKAVLNSLVLELFGERHRADMQAAARAAGSGTGAVEPLRVRWIAATFPFTTPSYEVEVWFRGKWLEILGSGVVMDRTLQNAGVKNHLGWAFGLGLERIAMVLYSIPDIRLFWSTDDRFLRQFAPSGSGSASSRQSGEHAGVSSAGGSTSKRPLITFAPYSRHPPCYKDVSFWLPKRDGSNGDDGQAADAQGPLAEFHENDFCEIVRDTAADLAEDVSRIDEFVHPKTGKRSLCYRINYRSMDRNLENEEVNTLHSQVIQRLVDKFGIEIR